MIILIIEDNITTSLLFKERLEYYKLNYKIANNGVEAYKILYDAKIEFDFIITNIGLPDENGAEIIKFIKNNFNNSKAIIYSTKKYSLFKDKLQFDFFYNKKKKTPHEIIDMIVNNNLE